MGNMYLVHHGIKGQKWGVRRFQNADGSLTNAGKKRYDEGSSNSRAKTIAKNVAIAGAAIGVTALAAYGIKNENVRNAILNMSKKSAEAVAVTAKKNAPAAKEFVKKAGIKAVKSLGESTERVGKAMTDAALISVGTVAISRLTNKLQTDENASQDIKDRNKIILDTTSAGITAATNAKTSSKGSNGKSGNSNELLKKTRDLRSVVGDPKGMFGADAERAYQGLFKKNPSDDQRALIKAMRKNGYSVDQIESYVFHSDEDSHFMIAADIGKLYVASIL